MVYGNEYGEIGTVYQAADVDYVGVMRAGGRAAVAINPPLAGTRGPARWRALASMRCRCHDARADTAARGWRDNSPDIRITTPRRALFPAVPIRVPPLAEGRLSAWAPAASADAPQ